MTHVRIDPITRLEGHGVIDIQLDSQGEVADAWFQVPELRGFEKFCVGRQAEDMPVLTARICGICPEAHLLASVKALDQLFQVTPPPAARKLRELLYMAFFVADHTTHFFALGGPDLLVGPDAPPSERNLLGVVQAVGLELGKQVLACRARNHQVIKTVGGRGIHPVAAVPGGWSKALSAEEQRALAAAAHENVAFALVALQLFKTRVLGNPALRELITGDLYLHRTYSLGTVDAANRVNLYDGTLRVVDPEGLETLRFPAQDYTQHLAERVEPWSYMKLPYLSGVGWRGLVDGKDSGVYSATPLARMNVADGMATPRAQAEREEMLEFFGCRAKTGRSTPVHHRLATHWARLVELLYAAEHMVELAEDPEVLSPEVRVLPPGGVRVEGGVGSVEAPRGTLIHHYQADERGVLTHVNLIVGTTHNHAPMAMSVKRAAQGLIHGGVVSEGLLNRVEMAFRLYDPCLSCATHALGQTPLTVHVRAADGNVLQTLRQGSGEVAP